jgi:hypothetical protein
MVLSAPAPEKKYDVIVYGGTSSGVIAAYAAAKEGLKVALLEPGRHVGGLTASGLGMVDKGFATTIGGYANDFFVRVGKCYGSTQPVFKLEPSVAEKTFVEMLQEAGVEVFFNARLSERAGVVKKGRTIEKLILENGEVFTAKTFIDATYEGDLMAWSKVSYIVGREDTRKYGESEAGRSVRGYSRVKLSQQQLGEIRDLTREFPLDYLYDEVGEAGRGDNKTQAYTFRLTLTTNEANKVAFTKPAAYNPARYKGLLNNILQNKITSFDKVCTVNILPNEKTDINHLDHVNASHKYPEGSYATRAYIWQYHKDYEMGYLYFVANDPQVPEALRKDAQRWGLARDEFADNANWPYSLYVREARRMVGPYVMVQRDAWEDITKEDAIGMGSYFLDSHEVQKTVTKDGYLVKEGELRHVPFRPYQIPYRSLVPKATECDNLLVTICLSASHVMYGSLRMEPVFMITGHAAGVAAAMCAQSKIAVQQIDVPTLQQKIIAQGQVMTYKPPEGAYIPKQSYSGIIVDNFEALMLGKWNRGYWNQPFVEGDYRYVEQSVNETASMVYQPALQQDGAYKVSISYNVDKTRSGKVKVLVYSEEGVKTIYVDMTKKSGGIWQPVGTYKFSKGKDAKVVISNEGAGGTVLADAVRFEQE